METYPTLVVEALCAFEVLRTLGFPSEEIFIEFTPGARMVAGAARAVPGLFVGQVILRTDGKEFVWDIGHEETSFSNDALQAAMHRAADDWNANCETKPWQLLFGRSHARRDALTAMLAIEMQGIALRPENEAEYQRLRRESREAGRRH